jgi:hypothetical protein
VKERVLKEFFEGRASAEELAADLDGSIVRRGDDVVEHHIADMAEQFALTPGHLVALCDAVLAGTVEPAYLETIGFGLVASDRFGWDTETPSGARLAEVAYDWAAPEVNYPLTLHNVAQWRRYLLGQPTDFETHPRPSRVRKTFTKRS